MDNTSELLTMDEIEARYDGEWVYIVDTEETDDFEVLRGRVLAHSPDHDELYRIAMALRREHAAILYIGKPREELAYIL